MFSVALLIASARNSHLLAVYACLSTTYVISATFNATTGLYHPFLSGFMILANLMLIFISFYFTRFTTAKLITPQAYFYLKIWRLFKNLYTEITKLIAKYVEIVLSTL